MTPQTGNPPAQQPSAPVAGRRWLRRTFCGGLLFGLLALVLTLLGVHLYAYHHLRAARQALLHYRDAQAAHHLRLCQTIWPYQREVLLLAARAARRQGHISHAEQHLEHYQNRHGADADLVLERTLLRVQLGELDAFQTFCTARIEQRHRSAPLILEAMVQGCLRTGRLHQAQAYLDLWLGRDPDNLQALWLQGRLWEVHQRSSEAAHSYRQALRVDPAFTPARRQLATVLTQLGQAREALPHVHVLQQALPGDAQVSLLQARCLELSGQIAQAIEVLDRAVEEHPRHALVLAERGRMALEQGKLEQAEQLLRRATGEDPSEYLAWFHLHRCLVKQGQSEQARQVQERLGQMETDLERLRRIVMHQLQLEPHEAGLYHEVGMLSVRVGKPAEAMRWFHQALEVDPQHGPSHEALAELYRHAGQPARAAEHRRRAQASGSSPPAQQEKNDRSGKPRGR